MLTAKCREDVIVTQRRFRHFGFCALISLILLGISPLPVSGAEDTSWLVSDELLDHAHLTRVWELVLPLKKDETPDMMTLHGGRLYLRSSRNYLWSLDRENGRVVFGQSIAKPGFAQMGWTAYGSTLISVVDNQLVEFDRDTGVRDRVSDLDVIVIAPPARNSRFFYLSGADRRLHALRAQNKVKVFEVSARDNSRITSILADEDTVVFGTDGGDLVAMMADAPRKLWQFDATGAIAGPVVRDGRSYYFASKDTNVYRIDEVDRSTASLAWRYQAEAILDRPPRVTGSMVYQYALGRGLVAIDKQSGRAVWSLPEGVDLLAEADGKACVITNANTLAVMDNRAGKRLYSMNLAGVVDHAANSADDMIYLADRHGRITCLRPVR